MGFNHDPAENSFGILKQIDGRDSNCFYSRRPEPSITREIPLRPVATRVSLTIDFNCQPRIAAKEVQDIAASRVLPAELQSVWPLTQPMPEYHFGKRHLPAQTARVSRRIGARLRCDVLEHGPSTMLRMVPLPETSSGRN